MKNLLDRILLSENVVKEFNINYNNLQFRNWLLNLLPEIEKCKNLKQDNPWHIYNCLEHILHTVEEMNKQTVGLDEKTKRLLAYTMFFHDIGKPDCLIRRFSKQHNREIDSFFNHNKASVRIAKRVVKDLGFSTAEQNILLALVDKHDIFMFITLEDDGNKYHKLLTNELINEEIEELNKFGNGNQLFNYLVMVGRSDNYSQNPELTANSLLMLDKIESMINVKTIN